MRHSLLFVVLCALLCTQCSRKNQDGQSRIGYSFEQTMPMAFEEIDYPELLGLTIQLVKKDTLLLVNDFRGDSLVSVFNLNSGRIKRKLFAVGNGPNEMQSPLDLRLTDDSLWILSRPMHLLSRISCAEMATERPCTLTGQVQPRADCFLPLDNRLFLYSGFWDKRYALERRSGEHDIREFGDYPDYWDEETDIPASAKAMFHQSRFAVNREKHLFASCSSHVLEIYRYDPSGRQQPELKFRKQLGRYTYNYQSGNMVVAEARPTSDPAAINIAAGKQHLYLLTRDRKESTHCNVMVVDWQGNPVRLMTSDKKISCLEVDETEGTGYCIVQDPDDRLCRFRLN